MALAKAAVSPAVISRVLLRRPPCFCTSGRGRFPTVRRFISEYDTGGSFAPFGAARFFVRPALIPRAAVRQRQSEDAAFAGETFRSDARVVQVCDLFDQREAEAQAAA